MTKLLPRATEESGKLSLAIMTASLEQILIFSITFLSPSNPSIFRGFLVSKRVVIQKFLVVFLFLTFLRPRQNWESPPIYAILTGSRDF